MAPGYATAKLDVVAEFSGAPQTVALVKKYAIESQRDHEVRLLAEQIVQHLGAKDYLSEILAVYYFVVRYTRYANDPRTVELVKKPGWVAKQIAAGQVPSLDCEDITTLIASLCLALGREVRVVTVAFADSFYKGERQFSHIYCQVKEPRSNVWIVCDPVAAEETTKMLAKVKALKIWPVA